MADFWEFLKTIFWHWQAWLGGTGIGGALVVLLGLYERFWSGHAMPKRIYLAIFIVGFLLAACYVAWQEQYHAALAAKAELANAKASTSPHLIGEISWGGSGTVPHIDSFPRVFILATISNLGAPSVARSFALTIDTTEGKHATGQIEAIPPVMELPVSQGKIRKLYREDALYDKGAAPIPTGGQITGVLLFSVRDLSLEDVKHAGTKWTLSFNDVTNNSYSCVLIAKGGLSQDVPYVPGMRRYPE